MHCYNAEWQQHGYKSACSQMSSRACRGLHSVACYTALPDCGGDDALVLSLTYSSAMLTEFILQVMILKHLLEIQQVMQWNAPDVPDVLGAVSSGFAS